MSKAENIYLAAVAGSLLCAACLFIPFVRATDDLAEAMSSPDQYEAFGYSTSGLSRASVFRFNTFYYENSGIFNDGGASGKIYLGMLVLLLALAALAVISAVRRKPVASLITCILSTAAFTLECFDFYSRGVVGTGDYTYHWDIGFYLYYVGVLIMLAGIIGMMIVRRRSAGGKTKAKE